MKKKQSAKEPAAPGVRKGNSSSRRSTDPSSTASSGGNKRLQRTSKLREQKESLKNSK